MNLRRALKNNELSYFFNYLIIEIELEAELDQEI